jgi:hypothetical protein
VDRFLSASDFYTIDVADSIGKAAKPEDVKAFADKHPELIGRGEIPGIEGGTRTSHVLKSSAWRTSFSSRFKKQVQFIVTSKRPRAKTSSFPKSRWTKPILRRRRSNCSSSLPPSQTTGFRCRPSRRSSPDVSTKAWITLVTSAQFEKEFNDDLCVIKFAIQKYGLPDNLKLSVHSGSDKFSIYPAIRRAVKKHGAGLHLKTAGTTWLEEVIGLAEAGGEGLVLAKDIYAAALEHIDELCAPYATVIDIDRAKLPTSAVVAQWTSEQYVNALQHEQSCKEFNPHLRQLLHVGFKIAAKKGARYLDLIRANQAVVSKKVTGNLFDRHIKQIFLS